MGFWIGCWHPNGRDPKMPRAIEMRDSHNIKRHVVSNQFLPPKVFTPHGNGVAGGNSGVPNIRIVQTITGPNPFAKIIESPTISRVVEVIGWKGGREKPLIGMAMAALRPIGHEYEPYATTSVSDFDISPPGQEGVARLESGESGGPTFCRVFSSSEMRLYGIHRGPGGPKGETWIAGVDTWLGHPQIHDWIMGIIGGQVIDMPSTEVEPEKVVRVCVPKGIKVIVEEIE